MQYAVHAGVKPATLDTFIGHPFGYVAGHQVITDLDGWNSWGEAPGTDTNDADTLHVLAYVDTLGTAIDLALTVASEYREYLVPSTGGNALPEEYSKQNDNLVIVSRADDWAEQYLVVTTTGITTVAAPVVED